MKKLIALCLSIILVGCSNATETTKTRSIEVKQQKLELNSELKNVAVFDMASLDMLDYLKIDVAGVAKDSIPKYLSKYEDDKYLNIGAAKEPDYEALSNMNPDLIIISGRTMEHLDKLKKIAPTILLSTDSTKLYASFEENAKAIGEIFNQQDQVNKVLENHQTKINEYKTKINTNLKALTLLTTDSKVSAFGLDSRFGLIHDVLNIPTADPSIEKAANHGQSVNFEYIAKINPDIIYVLDRDTAVYDNKSSVAVLDNVLVNKTKAAKNNKIVVLNSDAWYLVGISFQSLDIMLDDLKPSYK